MSGTTGQQRGACIGGIQTLDDLRGRCVITAGSDCWHLRSAYGRPLVPRSGCGHVVWVHGMGAMSATRVAWMLHLAARDGTDNETARSRIGKRVVYRQCGTHDCCNPAHLRCGNRAHVILAAMRDGRLDMGKVAHAARKTGVKRAVITPELRQWAIQSTQSGVAVAHALGVSQSRVNGIRAAARERAGTAAPSVFALGEAANY